MPTGIKSLAADLTVLLKEATRRLRAKTVKAVEARLEKALQRAFRAQGKRFMRHFERRVKKQWTTFASFREAGLVLIEGLEDELGAVFSAAELETLAVFLKPLSAAVQTALASGGRALIAELDAAISFSLRNPRAVAYLEAHGAELVKGINDTTRSYLQTLVVQAVDEGWSYNRTAQALVERYREFAVGRPQEHIASRAHLIAVTEAGEAYEAGAHQVISTLQEQGLPMEKRWVTMGDDRVSEGCAENEAEGWIPADQQHASGHLHPLRFPGCRCDEEYRVRPD